MLILNRNHFLYHNNKKYRCSLGKNGIKYFKKEGDLCTPQGLFRLGPVFYRKDRNLKLKTKLTIVPIQKNMYWEDNPYNINYNKLVFKKVASNEKLFRKDNIYDVIILINYNTDPILAGRGSAIFIHIAKKNYQPTKGCIALNKKDLLEILSNISKNEKILVIF